MNIHKAFLATFLLLALGGVTQISQGHPRVTKPRSLAHTNQKLSPSDIETLRKKAEQTRARRREARKRAAEAEQEAILGQSHLREEDWRELFRSSEIARKTIVPLLDELPVSVSEQGYTPQIKPWLGEVYKALAPQMAPRSQGGLLATLKDRLTLQSVALQCKIIELALLQLKADLREHNALLPEVDASLVAIRATLEQAQFLIDRMAGDSSESSQGRRLLAHAHCD